ncbi:serine hydrolase domain-containing protein [Saltatorellus ferox]
MKSLATLLLCSPLLTSAHSPAPPASAPDKVSKAIDAFLVDCAAFGWSGVVEVRKGSKKVFSGAYGFRNDEGEETCTEETLFDLGTLAQTVTAAAVLRLVGDGSLELDQPIADYLPAVPEEASGVTARHLLRQSSGWTGRARIDGKDGRAEALANLFDGEPERPAGEEFQPWTGNFIALAALVEARSEKSFEEYVREEIFAPAKLSSTRFAEGDSGEAEDESQQALGYEGRADPRAAGDPPGGQYDWRVRGTGGVLITASDFADFLEAQEGGKIVKGSVWDESLKRGPGDQGFGWEVGIDYQASCLRLEREGESSGFRSFASLNLGTKVFSVVLSNRSESPTRFLETTIRNLVSGEKMPVKQSIHPPETVAWKAKDLEAVAGSWAAEDGAELELERHGERSLRATAFRAPLTTASGAGVREPGRGFFAPVGKRELVSHAWVAAAQNSSLVWNGEKAEKAQLILTTPDGKARTLARQ